MDDRRARFMMPWPRTAVILAILSGLLLSEALRADPDLDTTRGRLDFEQADAMLEFLDGVAAGKTSEALLEKVLRSEGTALILGQLNLFRRVEAEQYEETLRALMEHREPMLEPVDDTEAAARGVSALRREVWTILGWGVENIHLLRRRLDELRAFEVRERALAEASRFLPRPVKLHPSFHVVMGGRAGAAALSQDRLYVDLLALSFVEVRTGEAYLGDQAVARFFAHETHHLGLARIIGELRASLTLSDIESQAFRVLQTLVQEGAATLLIDWSGDVESQRTSARFREPLAASDEWLHTIESLVADLLDGKAKNEADFGALTAVMLGDAYHVTGAVLLAAIQEAGGPAAVMQVLADPRTIFAEYNRARRQTFGDLAPGHSFDDNLADRVTSIGRLVVPDASKGPAVRL